MCSLHNNIFLFSMCSNCCFRYIIILSTLDNQLANCSSSQPTCNTLYNGLLNVTFNIQCYSVSLKSDICSYHYTQSSFVKEMVSEIGVTFADVRMWIEGIVLKANVQSLS